MDKIQLETPTLILGGGIAGSGRRAVLKELVKYVSDAFLIHKDTINGAFLSTLNPSDTGIHAYKLSGERIPVKDPYYNMYVRLQSYRCMLELAKDNLLAGKHPILDGNFTKEIRAGYLDEVVGPFFEDVSHQTKLLFFHADEATIRRRLTDRYNEWDAAKLESEETWRRFLEEQPILPSELERSPHLKVDTNFPLEENIQRILDYLSLE